MLAVLIVIISILLIGSISFGVYYYLNKCEHGQACCLENDRTICQDGVNKNWCNNYGMHDDYCKGQFKGNGKLMRFDQDIGCLKWGCKNKRKIINESEKDLKGFKLLKKNSKCTGKNIIKESEVIEEEMKIYLNRANKASDCYSKVKKNKNCGNAFEWNDKNGKCICVKKGPYSNCENYIDKDELFKFSQKRIKASLEKNEITKEQYEQELKNIRENLKNFDNSSVYILDTREVPSKTNTTLKPIITTVNPVVTTIKPFVSSTTKKGSEITESD